MKTYTIISRHANLAAAVQASGMDLSRNEASAKRDIARLDSGSTEYFTTPPVRQAFVVTDANGATLVLYTVEGSPRFLVKFDPFTPTLRKLTPLHSVAVEVGNQILVSNPVKLERVFFVRMTHGSGTVWATTI